MYAIRIGGTNDYVAKIDPKFTGCYPPGRVELVAGMFHRRVKKYPTLLGAARAVKMVEKIEGFLCSIETVE